MVCEPNAHLVPTKRVPTPSLFLTPAKTPGNGPPWDVNKLKTKGLFILIIVQEPLKKWYNIIEGEEILPPKILGDYMRFPLNHDQALILCKLINQEKLLQREMNWANMVILTQVGAIKMTKGGLAITTAGKKRFVKWARKEGMVA